VPAKAGILIAAALSVAIGHANAARADGIGGAIGTGNTITSWVVASGGGGVAAPSETTSCGPWHPGTDVTPHAGPPNVANLRQDAAGVVWTLYFRDCGTDRQWVWVPNLNAQQLAPLARDQVTRLLPKPDATFSPDFLHRSLNPFTLVRIPTLFAVPAAQWVPVSAQAEVPGLSVTATATPTQLVFTPGEPDGASVTCAGPGLIVRTEAEFPVTPPPCSYEYHHASSIAGGTFAASLTMRWDITWTASTGEGGSLTPASTTVDIAVPVREVQAIITNGD
jgi:hypothetical protein